MKCINCGAALADSAKFCAECGTKVGEGVKASDEDEECRKWLTIEDGVLTECDEEAHGKVIVPKGVTKIGDSAFYGCKALESIELPNSVKTIGKNAFECRGLKKIRYDGTMEEWIEVEKGEQWLTSTKTTKVYFSDGILYC